MSNINNYLSEFLYNHIIQLQKQNLMNTKYLVLLISLVLMSCQKKDECSSLDFGNQTLAEESKSYNLYEGVSRVVFMDVDSNEYEFSVTYSESTEFSDNHSVPCGDEEQTIGFERERKEVTLVGPGEGDHRINIILTTSFYHRDTIYEEDHLVDVLGIWHHRNKEDGPGYLKHWFYITSDKGGVVNAEAFNEYNEIENYGALGRNFGPVIEYATSDFNIWKPIFYSKELGVVTLFDISDRMLVYDRME